jgi:hypothetical protein
MLQKESRPSDSLDEGRLPSKYFLRTADHLDHWRGRRGGASDDGSAGNEAAPALAMPPSRVAGPAIAVIEARATYSRHEAAIVLAIFRAIVVVRRHKRRR